MNVAVGNGQESEQASQRVVVTQEDDGVRLDRLLAAQPAVGSRGSAERIVADGLVSVDGTARAKSYRVQEGELVVFAVRERAAPKLEPEAVDLTIAFEDEHLLVVDKPPGVVVHPSAGHAHGTLVHGLLHHGIQGGQGAFRPGIVHRLDRNTAGLLVVARSDEAHRRLARLIRDRTLVREYTALVRGRPASWKGRIDAPIGRDRRDPTKHSLDTDRPRAAFTNFAVTELLATHALLEVRLETGRTHQIRVHLATIGLPISGDVAYGSKDDLGLTRQFLHASRLAFVHPFTEAPVEVVSELPDDLTTALAAARAPGS